jgi:hypothetical protein
MRSRHLNTWATFATLSLAFVVSGCVLPGIVTGGGWIPSADTVPGHKANFGFSVSQCDLSTPPSGTFNYHDKTSKFSAQGSVKMVGSLADAGQCVNLPCSTNADCTAAADGTCTNVGGISVCLYPGETLTPCTVDGDCTVHPGGTCQDVTFLGDDLGKFCRYPGTVGTGSVGCLLCSVANIALNIPLPTNTYGFDVNYTSTNPDYPGNGSAYVCVIDNGQGSQASSKDFALLDAQGGPYDGYVNYGNVQGNISAHSCP